MKFIRLIVLLLVVVLVGACSDLAGQPQIVATIALPPTHEPVEVSDPAELGAAIFAARCTACHGVTGAGDGEVALNAGANVPDFTIEATSANQSLAEWTQTIKVGRLENLMPPWENSLSEEEINAVADYTYTLWQNPIEAPEPVVETVNSIEGTIAGTIIQGTANEPVPESIFMGLHVLDESDQQVDFRTLELENAESYAFTDITLRSDYRYLVTAVYNDIVFSSERIATDGLSESLTVPVTVYEITDDPSVIHVDLMTTMLFEENERLVSQNFLRFNNTSDRVFRTDAQVDTFAYESIRIPIPEDAVMLNMEALAQRFSLYDAAQGQVLVDSRPVVPGENHMVEVIYGVPYSGRLTLNLASEYPVVEKPELYLPPDQYELSGGTFGFVDLQTFNFGAFERYVGFPFAGGDSLTVTVIRQGSNALPREVVVSIIVLVIGVSFISVGVWSLYQQRRNATLDEDVSQKEV